ncbi:23S rRNA (guanosine(2251)-2'-O)-methyltransferase RlmB [Abiotrophia defectiva]
MKYDTSRSRKSTGKRQTHKKKYDETTDKKIENKTDVSPQEEIIFGKHAVMETLKKNKGINKLFYQKGLADSKISSIIELVKNHGGIFQEVPKSKLDELTQGANHQGLVLTVPPFDYQTIEDCLALAESKGQPPFLLILDGIEDPHNLGSILRTADAFGVHGIIIPKRRAVGLTGIVAKTSTGAIEHVPVVRVANIAQTIELLQNQGIWVFATDMAGEDVRQWNSQGPLAIVIGNEGQGVSPLVKQKADGIVTIPMVGHVQSLNASVAAGVLVYEVARHRMN